MKKRLSYCIEEDDIIFNYVNNTNKDSSVQGTKLWAALVETNLVPDRSADSLKGRYKNVIVPKMKKQFAHVKGIEWKDGRIVNLDQLSLSDILNVEEEEEEKANDNSKREREEEEEEEEEEDGLFELAKQLDFEEEKKEEYKLTIDAVRRMCRNLPCKNPILQVLSFECDKNIVTLSDGAVFAAMKMMPAISKKFKEEEEYNVDIVVKILEFSSMKVMDKRSVLILNLEIVHPSITIVGNPIIYEDEAESVKKQKKKKVEEEEEDHRWKRMYYLKSPEEKVKVWVACDEAKEVVLNNRLITFKYQKKDNTKDYTATVDHFEEIEQVSEKKEKKRRKKKEIQIEQPEEEGEEEEEKEEQQQEEQQQEEVLNENAFAKMEEMKGLVNGMEGGIEDLIDSLIQNTNQPRNVVIHSLFVNNCWADAAFDYLTNLDVSSLKLKPWEPSEDLAIFMHSHCLNILQLPDRTKEEIEERDTFLAGLKK